MRVTTTGLAIAGLLVLAACGSDQATSDTLAASPTFQTNDSTAELDLGVSADPAPAEPPPTGESDGAPAVEPAVQPAVLGGRAFDAAVAPASEIETNQLPDLVVDDVRRESKSNFRNIFPADRPVLLWLWAPH